jgi:hypothetical protein
MPLGNREDQTTGYQHEQYRCQDARKSNPALALRSLNCPRFYQDQSPVAGMRLEQALVIQRFNEP